MSLSRQWVMSKQRMHGFRCARCLEAVCYDGGSGPQHSRQSCVCQIPHTFCT